GYAVVVADHDGLRHTARALHRALNRSPAHAEVRLLWLYSDEEVPVELREGASLLPRLATDATLRAVLHGPHPADATTTSDHTPTASAAGWPAALPASEDASAQTSSAGFAQAAAAPLPSVTVERGDTAPEAEPSSGPPRLLLVEDNPVNLLVAQKLL